MKKQCPRCGSEFDCRHESILECECSQVRLTVSAGKYLEENYPGQCLCRACLEKISAGDREPGFSPEASGQKDTLLTGELKK